LVVKRDGDTILVLLIQPSNREYWQLPKGAVDEGESPGEAAIREVREEGGVEAEIITALEPITFFYQWKRSRFVKTVDFFLMEYRSGSPEDHDREVREARWAEAAEAATELTFASERGVLEAALGHLRMPARAAS
jgi:8-oxo-dGTP pyrophosphatase MutT (NUDIX family)